MRHNIFFTLIVFLLFFGTLSINAQIPRTLSYQGVLTDSLGNPKPDGTYTLTFRLYDSESGGNVLWAETKLLQVKRGLFKTILGDETPLPDSLKFDRPYWLSLQVASESELSPRIPLTAVGYSLYSIKADTAKFAITAPQQSFIDSARIAGTVPTNSITSQKILDSTIQRVDVVSTFTAPYADTAMYARGTPSQGFVDSARVAGNVPDNSITSAKILDGTIQRVDVTPTFTAPYSDTATYARYAPSISYVDSARIAGGVPKNSITSTHLVNDAVNSAKILDGSITSAKIANGAVASDGLAASAVTTEKINNGAVTGTKIAQAGATTGQALKWNGITWSPANDTTGSGPFTSTGGITSNSPITDHFVFGSTSMDNITGIADDNRMFFNKTKGAFRAGYTPSNEWDDSNVGSFSFAVGYGSKALGNYSTALGSSIASGISTTALGISTAASGDYSTAMGYSCGASGTYSTAIGYYTIASGIGSTAMGFSTIASGYNSTSLGSFNVGGGNATSWVGTDPLFEIGNGTAPASRSNAMTILKNGNVGIGTTSPAAPLHIVGTETGGGNVVFVGERKTPSPGNPPVSGTGTRMMWYPDKAAFRAGHAYSNEWDKASIGDYSIATGHFTTASGLASTALGNGTKAYGDVSTAIGHYTNAYEDFSTSMGYYASAYGYYSTAMGNWTSAGAYASTAIGSYNVGGGNATSWVGTDPLFEIGNGTAPASRSNAMTILKNGNVGLGTTNPSAKLEVSGQVKVTGGTPGAGKVLTSDAGGLATWQVPESSPWLKNGYNIYYNTGSVGIGVVNPLAFLNIQGNTNSTLPHLLLTESESDFARLSFKNTVTSTKNWTIAGGLGATDANSFLNFWYWNGTTGTDILSISGDKNLTLNGKLGLGMTPKNGNLEILNADYSLIKLYTNASGTTVDDGLEIFLSAGNSVLLYNHENGPIHFGTNGLDRMVISASGDIGIGNMSPSYKMDISGPLNLNKDIASGVALRCNGTEAIWYDGTMFSWGFGGTYNYFADKVTIGNSANPSYMLYVQGSAYATGTWSSSDVRFKKNVSTIDNALDKIKKVRGTRFEFRNNEFKNYNFTKDPQFGFIAQELENVFPEVVKTETDGYKSINYDGMIPVLLEAVKEQQKTIDDLQKRIEELEKRAK